MSSKRWGMWNLVWLTALTVLFFSLLLRAAGEVI